MQTPQHRLNPVCAVLSNGISALLQVVLAGFRRAGTGLCLEAFLAPCLGGLRKAIVRIAEQVSAGLVTKSDRLELGFSHRAPAG